MLKKIYENGKFSYRRARRNLIMYKRSSNSWMREIHNCQEKISTLTPFSNKHYKETYRRLEPLFWSSIPEWIARDNKGREVKRSLDIGCGYGTLSLYVKKVLNCDIYTTDFVEGYGKVPKLLSDRESNWFYKVSNIELEELPWNLKYDIILFTEVLEHLNFYPVPTLKKIHDALADRGRLYLSTPDAAQWGRLTKYYSDLEQMPLPEKGLPIVDDHVYVYTKAELLQVLSKAGFVIERFGYSPGEVSRHFNFTLKKK